MAGSMESPERSESDGRWNCGKVQALGAYLFCAFSNPVLEEFLLSKKILFNDLR